MNNRVFSILLLASVLLTGCGITPQRAAMGQAHSAFEAQDYGRCLKEVSSAENHDSNLRIMDAQILFYKAMCLERIGEKKASQAALEKIVWFYPETDWAVAAARKMTDINCRVR